MEHTSSRGQLGASLPAAYLSAGTSSFTDFLRSQAPDLLPGARGREPKVGGAAGIDAAPHGTTIVALTFAGGVLIAGDRRATAGNLIAQRDIEKVFITDDYSSVGIAGTAGLAVEMVRLYTVELRHYEKIEGVQLSLDGKTNKLASMVRGNLDVALAGLAVLPLFVGYDIDAADPARAGRIVSFDITGGRYEERAGFHAIGSGSMFARSALKKLYQPDGDRAAALRAAVEALYDAADDDSATGGPDMARGIYPSIATITADEGSVRVSEQEAAEIAAAVVAERAQRPRG
ncbi:proteasome subunit beta [Actinokineospora globicatena]|uniref:Proteasome subunit beta n=1 Tax=Actinokineospora globicatena TaxID=103729 RepID=A0A9W6VB80_9PSEU|nr:proteasome subunit beta [Actinokineospora globicatena]MCP2306643.1 proteasome beta subunit [Actinokineospora globicatena]GLW82240.1 proteasome subunit beta [Actinokineospora globicatena]GLW89033.1 proteasome subunit beta [Actinokineospora globicatena]GLW95027.1 proteasome subunit beta [Actinokineospora globicatena]